MKALENLKKTKILFVDDNESIAEAGEIILSELGYSVTAVTESKKAFKIFENNPEEFDLIITDFNMPEIMGNELAKSIRSIRTDIPIILATGSATFELPDLNEYGIDEMIMKPYLLEDIDSLISRVLNSNYRKAA